MSAGGAIWLKSVAREQAAVTAAALWARLSADGLVEGEMPEPGRPASPWYVRTMLGIAGWIGALFLLAFLGAAFSLLVDDCGVGPGRRRRLLRRRLRLVPGVRRQRLRRAVRARRQPGRAGADDHRPQRTPRRPRTARRSISRSPLIEAALALARSQFPSPPARHLRRGDRASRWRSTQLRCTACPHRLLCAGLGSGLAGAEESGPAADGCGGRSATGWCSRFCWSRRSACSTPEPCSALRPRPRAGSRSTAR